MQFARNHKLRHSMFATALGLSLTMLDVHAQQVPDIGEALRQSRPATPPPVAPPVLPVIGGAPTEPPMAALPGGGATVQVKEITVVGNRVIDTATLLALVQPDQGKALSLAQLDEIATRITRYYRSQGYFVARAYVPAQELVGGTVTLRVVEGNYGRFILDNKSLVRDDVVQGLLDDIKDRDIVSLDTLERAMLIINDTPGARIVRADVMPGEKVGTSDFAIGSEATARYDGYVILDNYGSVYTGKKRLSFNGDWNSPTGRGDRLSASGLVTSGSGLLNGRLAYSTLVASNGTRLEGAVSRTRYELGDSYAPLGATGTANSLEASLTTPLKRTREQSVEGGLGFAWRDLKDSISSTSTDTRKRTISVNAGVSTRLEQRLLGTDGQLQASASVTLGRLTFDDATAEALDAAGAKTQGTYAKLNLQVVRATLLPNEFSLTTSARAQVSLSNKNLDGSERMSISGPSGVVAYAPGEMSGDHAAVLRAELARPLALPLAAPLHLSANLFFDYGWAKAAKPLLDQRSRDLADVGVGLSANGAGGLLRLQLAHRVAGGAPTSEPTSRTRVLVQGGWVF